MDGPQDSPSVDKRAITSIAGTLIVALLLVVAGLGFASGFKLPTMAGALWALAATAAGGFLGFLFGIPRVLQPGGRGKAEPDTAQAGGRSPEYAVNTNLVEISDWLTKIIVGVGLIELKNLPGAFQSLAGFAASGMPDITGAEALAGAILAFFSIGGFLGGYLGTRLHLTQAFVRADSVMVGRSAWGIGEAFEKLRTLVADLSVNVASQGEQLTSLQQQVASRMTPDERLSMRAAAEAEPRLKVENVLWVDDNPDNNSFEILQLEETGAKVVTALTTEEGLSRFEAGRFQAVITDMGRQEGRRFNQEAGLELARGIRNRDPDVLIVFYTSPATVTRMRAEVETAGARVTASPTELLSLVQSAG